MDLIKPGEFYQMGVVPIRIDILTEIAGVDFKQAWGRRVINTIDDKTVLQAAFISADDLIAAKRASARPQDLADVDAIQKARREKETK